MSKGNWNCDKAEWAPKSRGYTPRHRKIKPFFVASRVAPQIEEPEELQDMFEWGIVQVYMFSYVESPWEF